MSSVNEPPVSEQSLIESVSITPLKHVFGHDFSASSLELFTGHGQMFKTIDMLSQKNPSSIMQNAFVQQTQSSSKAQPIFFIYNHAGKKKTRKKDKEDDVSEEFVQGFNDHIGNSKNEKKAQRLIEKMRLLGGLIPSINHQKIDVPSARLGFSILAELNHPQYKMEALDHLIELLQNDNNEKESSVNLVTLAIKLMGKMNRELFQTEIIDIQIKITQAYSLIAELLQRHYAKKHINAVTKELKLELIETIKALESLNSQQDPQLNLYVHLALEGVRRLVDDRKELFDLIERFYHLLASAAASQIADAYTCFIELSAAFRDLDPHLPNVWYNGVLIINALAKEARDDPNKLAGIQVLIGEKRKVFNWKFTYAALDVLYDLTVHGQTAKLRKTAFEGIKMLGPDFPGLASFANCQDFSKHVDMSPLVHFKKPQKRDPNIIIRLGCAKHLIRIADNAPDMAIRKRAKQLLIRRLQAEKDEGVRDYLERHVPKIQEEQEWWLKNDSGTNIVRIHRRRTKQSPKLPPKESGDVYEPLITH